MPGADQAVATGMWLVYKKRYDVTDNPGVLLATFCTAPAIRSRFWNFVTQEIGTFTLVFAVV